MRIITIAVLFFASIFKSPAQIKYPYPIRFLHLTIENKLQMAYMDVASNKSNGKTIILFHGKNLMVITGRMLFPCLRKKVIA